MSSLPSHSSRCSRQPRAALSPLALAAFLAVASAPALTARAAEQASTAVSAKSYQISAGPLATVLGRFAAASGVALSFDPALVKDLQSPGLQGSYAVPAGFANLLAGAGLEAVDRGNGEYTLCKAVVNPPSGAAASSLAAVTVTAAADVSGTSEGSGSYTSNFSRSATGLNLSLRETPQSISVMTRQRMDDQGLLQLTDVLQQTTGLFVDQSGAASSDTTVIYSRGFAVNSYQIDGVNQINSNYDMQFQTDDMVLYDRAEVVRGATGMMNGVGSPGAAINLVRKRPTDAFQASVQVQAGSWNFKRTELDISSPLNQAGTLRGRLIGAWQDNDSYVDRLHEKKEILSGIIEADVAPGTLLTAGFSLQNHDYTGLARSGLPLYNSDGSLATWSREKSAAANWAYTTRHNQALFASLDHRFDNGWTGKLSYNHGRHKYDEQMGYAAAGYVDPTTGAGIGLWSTRFAGNPTQDSLDASFAGPFELFGRRHEAAFGVATSRTQSDEQIYGRWYFDGWDSSVANIYTWDGNTPAAPYNPSQGQTSSTERNNSVFASVRFKPTDALSLLTGARATRWRYGATSTYVADGSSSTDNRAADKVTPYAAAVLDVSKSWSVYASYTTVFRPQSYAKDITGSFLDPESGKGYEIGTKAALWDDRANFSAAIYETKLNNVAEWVRDDIYRAIQGVTTKGFEAELSGALARNWQASIGFSRNLSRDGADQPVNTDVPKNNLKLYTSYKLPDVGGGLTLGGGIRWQNQTYKDNRGPNGERFEQGAYAVADVMLRYAFNRNVEATLNINNLFDRHYYSSVNSAYAGAPRNVMAGLRWKI